MIILIITKELRDIIGSARFSITFGVCSLLILLTFYVGARNYQSDLASYEAARAENLRQLEGVTDWISVRDHRVFLPPQPLAVLVSGISNDIGRTMQIQGRGEPSATDSRYGDDPVFAVFRFLDLEFLFAIVLSLMAIVYGYDAINGEKERGTLRLTFSSAVPRHLYIIGKLTGSFLALAIPLLIPMLLGSLLLPLLGVHLSGEEWGRLVIIIGAGILYFTAFLALAIFVSALTQRSSNSFLMLLVVWIFAVLILPRTAVLLAGRAVSVPSIDEIETQKSRLAHQLWTEDRKKMASFTPSSTGDMQAMVGEFNKFMTSLGDTRDKKMRELSDRLNEERANAQQRQQAWALGIARISPTTAFSLAATTLAGTSLSLQSRYRQAALAYQEVFGSFMQKKTGMRLGGGMIGIRVNTDNGEKPKPIDPKELPAFEYKAAGFAGTVPAALVDMGILCLFAIVFFAGAYVAFRRYDVR
jgi:ABC-type transport system involved in multi-copper enzyme maturation permease subunit